MSTAKTQRSAADERPLARLHKQSRQVEREAHALADAARAVLEELTALARGELRARPYATLGVASGVGYVLGGGVPTRIACLLLDGSLKLAVTAVVTTLIAGATQERSTTQ